MAGVAWHGESLAKQRASGSRWVLLAILLAGTYTVFNCGAAIAVPPPIAADGSVLDHIVVLNNREWNMYVYSTAMKKVIQLKVIRPADTTIPRPTFYLLNGAGGGEDEANWQANSDVVSFFADKNVNVVTPVGGRTSYYTDWQKADPVLGVNEWTTFLTEELPPIVDSALGTTGVNAIAGLSTSGSAVLSLAEAAPWMYRAVASYSGCAETSTLPGRDYVNLVVNVGGGGNVDNMWGPPGDPDWAANDAYLHADRLRGVALYISNRTGLPGPHDTLTGPGIDGNPLTLFGQAVIGGVIEAGTNQCTHRLVDKLETLDIPATVVSGPGTHSWGYWQDDLHNSWSMLAHAIGL